MNTTGSPRSGTLARSLRARRSLNASTRDVAVFTAVGELIREWKDDPERLAVAAYAYERVLGYASAASEIRGGSHDDALRRVDRALRGRNRKLLRARAEGLVMAVQALAEDANAWDLHQRQHTACVIECRELPIDERVERLRAQDAERTGQ